SLHFYLADLPAMETVTDSPGAAQPQTRGTPCCTTMLSPTSAGSLTSARFAAAKAGIRANVTNVRMMSLSLMPDDYIKICHDGRIASRLRREGRRRKLPARWPRCYD